MIDLKFPDGSVRQFPEGSTGRDVAHSISPSLAKRTVLVRLDGEMRDYDRPLKSGAIELVARDAGGEDVLDVIRHDTAHAMAQAVQELFPGTQVTIGPNIEDGFFYDFAREEPFSLDDLPKIEQRMREIVDRDEKIVREEVDRDAAIADFEAMGETYKAEIIRDLPASDTITVYHQGPKWKDLCRGPHLPSTKAVGQAFKLTKLAGAYWRGDQNNAQLQRLRHRLGDPGGARRLSQARRGGGKARPSQDRPGHGPVPPPGRGPGHGLLARRGLDPVADAGGLYPPPARGRRL
jgi:threonyl-tRNA synthetase